MTKLYTPDTWVDEVLSGAERYNIKTGAGVAIYNAARVELSTAVAVAGTDLTAAKMNNIEDGLDAVDTRLNAQLIKKFGGLVTNPQTCYTQRAQLFLFYTDVAIHITDILIDGNDNTPTAEMAGDLKWASDPYTGSFADAAVLHICDTTNGKFSITAHSLAVAAGKYIYFQWDASPHADWKDFLIRVLYTEDGV